MYIWRAYQILILPPRERYSHNKNAVLFALGLSFLGFVLAIFFLAFVGCMCYDQYDAFTTGVAGVDAMQIHGDIPKKQSCSDGFVQMVMINEKFSVKWFLPIPPKIERPPLPSVDSIKILKEPEKESDVQDSDKSNELSQSSEIFIEDTSTVFENNHVKIE